MIDPNKKLKNKTIIVTGGAGFVGSHLCDALLSYGVKVVCFDNLSTGSKLYIISKSKDLNFAFVLGDVNALPEIEKTFARYKPDYVFHYASIVGVKRTMEMPLEVFNDIEGIKNICVLSAKYGVKKIVYSSSSEVYGNQKEVPFHEDLSYHDTKHPYAIVKAIGESYFKSYSAISGIPVTSLRFFNVYGPRQASSAYGFVVGIFISQVLRNLQPTIFRDGTQTRDFTYIKDNVEAAIQAMVNEKADGHVLNIGTGMETSVLELAKKIIYVSGKKVEPKILEHINLAETQRRVANTQKMKNIIGFEPQVSFDEGLRLTYNWYKNNPQFILSEKNSD